MQGVRHTDACHERFRKLLEGESERVAKESKSKAAASKPVHPEVQCCAGVLTKTPEGPMSGDAESTRTEHPEVSRLHGNGYLGFDQDIKVWRRVHIKPRRRFSTSIA